MLFKLYSLAFTTGNDDSDNVTSYANLMNSGGMTHPTESFLEDIKKFYECFCSHHPKDDIKREAGIITGFANHLLEKFPQYEFKVLYLVSKIFTVVRLREVNNLVFKRKLLARKKKAKDENSRPYSTRGKIQLGRLSKD